MNLKIAIVRTYILNPLAVIFLSGCTLNVSVTDLNRLVNPTLGPIPVVNVIVDDVSEKTDSTPLVKISDSSDSADSNLVHYEYSLGTTSGATDIRDWTDLGMTNSFSAAGLNLEIDKDYYVNVRSVDKFGRTSLVSSVSWRTVKPVDVVAQYSAAPNWNDYVRVASQSTVCDGTETNYFSCYHGGEKKKSIFADATSCSGYEISDRLGAFDWGCDDSGGVGNVFFYSKGLKYSKGLADLLDEEAWKLNRVVISYNGVPVAASPWNVWWTNPVKRLPDSLVPNSAASLSGEGTIFTIAQTRTTEGSYQVASGADGTKIGIVTLNGAVLKLGPSASVCGIDNSKICLVMFMFGSKFNWIEGNYEGPGDGASTSFSLGSSRLSVIRRLQASRFGYGLGSDFGAQGIFFHQLRLSRAYFKTYVKV